MDAGLSLPFFFLVLFPYNGFTGGIHCDIYICASNNLN
jgi:hypothetical protein